MSLSSYNLNFLAFFFLFLSAVFLHGLMTPYIPFLICKLPNIIEKNRGVVSPCLLHELECRVLLSLDLSNLEWQPFYNIL